MAARSMVHAQLGLGTWDAVLGHPVAGSSWEGFVVENLLAVAPLGAEAYFYRSAAGADIDLLLRLPGGALWAVEIKRSLPPSLRRGFHHACDDLQPQARYLVYPGHDRFPVTAGATALGLEDAMRQLSGAAASSWD